MSAENLITIPARKGKAARVKKGQRVKLINTHGSQVVDTCAVHPELFPLTRGRIVAIEALPGVWAVGALPFLHEHTTAQYGRDSARTRRLALLRHVPFP